MKFHHHLLHLSHYQGWWEACGSSIIQRGLLRLEYVLKVLLRHQEILGIYKWWCYSLQLSLSQAFRKTWQQREQLLSSIMIICCIGRSEIIDSSVQERDSIIFSALAIKLWNPFLVPTIYNLTPANTAFYFLGFW